MCNAQRGQPLPRTNQGPGVRKGPEGPHECSRGRRWIRRARARGGNGAARALPRSHSLSAGPLQGARGTRAGARDPGTRSGRRSRGAIHGSVCDGRDDRGNGPRAAAPGSHDERGGTELPSRMEGVGRPQPGQSGQREPGERRRQVDDDGSGRPGGAGGRRRPRGPRRRAGKGSSGQEQDSAVAAARTGRRGCERAPAYGVLHDLSQSPQEGQGQGQGQGLERGPPGPRAGPPE
jgi:hypothetical protein